MLTPMPDDTPFSDRLAAAIDRLGVPACVGLDPVVEKLPEPLRARARDAGGAAGAIAEFCLGVIDASAPHAAAFKPQSACFERFGAPGVAALREVIAAARARGAPVILDAKRGDIGITAEHYAAAAVALGADAITVSAYLGPETLRPYLDAELGVFALVRTSNADSDAVQGAALADGRTVAQMVADHVAALGATRVGRAGLSDVGAVVGATKSSEAAGLRARMPDQVFLVPGYGAQGGTAEDVRVMLRRGSASPGTSGVIVSASRSVITAFDPGDRGWTRAVGGAARRFADALRRVVA